jgi:nitrite reductase/ring-hydroxylating ferredoxin subunit
MAEHSPWVAVVRSAELSAGQSRKFHLLVEGQDEECFVVNFRGRFFAYVNRCRHVPISLDWVDNQFFTADGNFLQCATHGAKYLPDTGECVAGPPCGKFLHQLPVLVSDGVVYVRANDPGDEQTRTPSGVPYERR